jgi:hypothetical protein
MPDPIVRRSPQGEASIKASDMKRDGPAHGAGAAAILMIARRNVAV